MERERFDGADVAHLLASCAPRIDWRRLIERFGPDWHVLMSPSYILLLCFSVEAELSTDRGHGRIERQVDAGAGRAAGSAADLQWHSPLKGAVPVGHNLGGLH